LQQNPDVAHAEVNPLLHFVLDGAKEGRDPHPLFDSSFYVEQNPDVAATNLAPVVHYLTHGAGERRNPHPLFDTSFYLQQNPEVAHAQVNPLLHFVLEGAKEGHDPHPLFDTSFYMEKNPDVAQAGVNPLYHYLISGAAEGRDPHPFFDSSYYLERNPDVAQAGVNPLCHYAEAGARQIESPVKAWLDAPLEGSSITDVLAISGWAFSTAAPVVEVQACLDGTPPRAVRCGLARKDVLAVFPRQAPLECGYEDLIPLHTSQSGAAILMVRIADALGNRQEIIRPILVAPPTFQLGLECPTPDSVSAGTMVVGGWAFSRRSRIVEVNARLGTLVQSALRHGFRRPDVEAAFGDSAAALSGFRGVVRFEPGVFETTERLVVRATDDLGESIEAEVRVRVIPSGKSVCDIERARWRGDLLEVEGWAGWPKGLSLQTARILLDGRLVGETRLNLSRPDLRWRFPAQPTCAFRGFRVSTRCLPQPGQAGRTGELTVECVDREGCKIWRTTQMSHEPGEETCADGGVARAVEEALGQVRSRLERDPTVLDWNSGLGLARVLSRLVVFSPPGAADVPSLPYLDGTVDVVVLPSADPVRVAEARRVASAAVLGLSDLPASDTTAEALRLEWTSEATAPSSLRRHLSSCPRMIRRATPTRA